MIIFNGQPIDMEAIYEAGRTERAIKERCSKCIFRPTDIEDAVFVEEQPNVSDDFTVHPDSDIPWGEETNNDL